MRPAVTSLGPVLAEVRTALGMGAAVAGLLTSVPVACFALIGTVAPRLARRFSAATVVGAGLAASVVGLAARVFMTGTVGFAAFTALALAGIAPVKLLLPAVVKDRFPDRSARSRAGTRWPSTPGRRPPPGSRSVPIAGAFGGGWRVGLGVWALLAALSVPPWVLLSRDGVQTRPAPPPGPDAEPDSDPDSGPDSDPDSDPDGRPTAQPDADGRPTTPTTSASQPRGGPTGGTATADAPPPAGPMARNPVAWALAAYFGLQATSAYVIIGWLPQIFRDLAGRDREVG